MEYFCLQKCTNKQFTKIVYDDIVYDDVYNDRHSKRNIKVIVYYFQDNFHYTRRTPLDILGYKIDMLNISCFMAFFSPIVLVLEEGYIVTCLT